MKICLSSGRLSLIDFNYIYRRTKDPLPMGSRLSEVFGLTDTEGKLKHLSGDPAKMYFSSLVDKQGLDFSSLPIKNIRWLMETGYCYHSTFRQTKMRDINH